MPLRFWVRKLFPRNTIRSPIRRRTALRLEPLEERLTPSTYTVTDAGDTAGSAGDVTLRYALTQAVARHDQNAVIDFNLAANTTITLSQTAGNTSFGTTAFIISGANITLNGSGAPGLAISGGGALRPFTVAGTGGLMLENLTLENGLAQGKGVAAEGGAVYSSGSLKLDHVTVQNNNAQGSNGANATFIDTVPPGAGADAAGGGLYVAGGTFTLTNDTLRNNSAQGGQGGNNSSIKIAGPGGAAGAGLGGGLYVAAGGGTLTNDTFADNSAQGGTYGHGDRGSPSSAAGAGLGGGLCVAGGSVVLTNDTLSGNSATGGAGGNGGNPFSNGGAGGAGLGGGLDMAGGSATLSNDTISGNSAKGGTGGPGFGNTYVNPGAGGAGGASLGGGLYLAGGSVTLSSDTLNGNSAQGGTGGHGGSASIKAGDGGRGGAALGGGLYLAEGSPVLTNLTLSGNAAQGGQGGNGSDGFYRGGDGGMGGTGLGGGLYLAAGSPALTNDTLSGNSAQGGTGGHGGQGNAHNPSHGFTGHGGNGGAGGGGQGGGLYLAAGSSPTLIDTLAALDQLIAGSGGGAGGGIIPGASGPAGTTSAPDLSGNVSAGGHDLIGDGTGSSGLANGVNGNQVGTAANPIQPRLGRLQNNGGPTPTIALLPGSPAIAAGSPVNGVTTDQRGLPRNAVPDIGAYETQIPTVRVTDNGGTYNGSPYPVTAASVTGRNNAKIASFGDPALSYSYYAGKLTVSQLTGATPLANAPTNAGPYTVVAHFTSNVTGYRNADSAPRYFAITPATLSITNAAVNAVAGAPFAGTLATFTSTVPLGSPASFTARINWSDGSTSTGVITGNGNTYTVSGSHTYAAAGNHTIQVVISQALGDFNAVTVQDSVTITNLGMGIQANQTWGTSFWDHQLGLVLIARFNGGPSATALSTWLATTFPNLFGSGAGANNLTGLTNAQVSTFYQNQFVHGLPAVEAQVLTTAFNIYATTLSLGGTAGQSYGFSVSADGLGADSFNVAADGAAFGVPNRTTLNVYQLLLAVNAQAVNGVPYNGNTLLQAEANDALTLVNVHRS